MNSEPGNGAPNWPSCSNDAPRPAPWVSLGQIQGQRTPERARAHRGCWTPTASAKLGSLAGKGHYSREGRLFERIDPTNAIVGTGASRGAGGAASDDFTIRARLLRGHHRRQVDLHRAPGTSCACPSSAWWIPAGGVKLLMQIGGTKIPEYPSWPATNCSRRCRWSAWRSEPARGRCDQVLSSHFSVMVRGAGCGDGRRAPCGAAGLWRAIDKNAGRAPGAPQRALEVHNEAVDGATALAQVQRFLAYLPRGVPTRTGVAPPPTTRTAPTTG